MKPLKQSISVSLDPDIIAALIVVAEKQDRSLSSCINIILRHWLKRHQLL